MFWASWCITKATRFWSLGMLGGARPMPSQDPHLSCDFESWATMAATRPYSLGESMLCPLFGQTCLVGKEEIIPPCKLPLLSMIHLSPNLTGHSVKAYKNASNMPPRQGEMLAFIFSPQPVQTQLHI